MWVLASATPGAARGALTPGIIPGASTALVGTTLAGAAVHGASIILAGIAGTPHGAGAAVALASAQPGVMALPIIRSIT